jgi:hypothetical protein
MSVEYVLELYSSDASWGPSTKLAEVWDARNLGWARYDRLAAKAFATLAQTSPHLSLITKLQTHVKITRVAPSGNTEVFNGLLVDYDSTGDDVVLDVADYTSLLGTSRCNYKKMYPTKKLGSQIVSPEWTLAKNATGSRLGFVTSGTIEDPVGTDGTTPIKTNATFGVADQMRLAFFYDLSEMGRANTAYHVTFEISRTSPFTFTFLKNKGTARDIPLVLNGTVSDYRFLPGWRAYKNDVATLGGSTGGGSVEIVSTSSSAITSLGRWQDAQTIRTVMGIVGKTAEIDQQKAATERILKRSMEGAPMIAVTLVTGAIEPFSGWDVCDTMPVEVVNGIDNLTGAMRVLGVRAIYDEAGEQINLIMGPVLT